MTIPFEINPSHALKYVSNENHQQIKISSAPPTEVVATAKAQQLNMLLVAALKLAQQIFWQLLPEARKSQNRKVKLSK